MNPNAWFLLSALLCVFALSSFSLSALSSSFCSQLIFLLSALLFALSSSLLSALLCAVSMTRRLFLPLQDNGVNNLMSLTGLQTQLADIIQANGNNQAFANHNPLQRGSGWCNK